MKIFFWQNLLSPHQGPFIRELAARGHEVTVIAAEEMSPERRRLGWVPPELGRARSILASRLPSVRATLQASPGETIHLIAGARGTRLGVEVARLSRELRRRTGIISEAPDSRGVAGVARRVKYTVERWSPWAGHFDVVLAFGEMGVRWFRTCGYDQDRVFPFAYCTESTQSACPGSAPNPDGPFRFLYVGRLVRLKGVDLLVRALEMVPDATLTIVGDGEERKCLESLANAAGTAPRIEWVGMVDAIRVRYHMRNADALVLPSRKDGWGAVVNEALQEGTPVVCSAACGGAELVRHPVLGTVFDAGRVEPLVRAMIERTSRGRATIRDRRRIMEWSQCIDPRSIATYLEAVLLHVYSGAPVPCPPWRLMQVVQ